MTEVKICGLKDPDMIRRAVEAGADFIGLNFVEASPRYVPDYAAASLLLHMGDARPVALVANASDAAIDTVAALGFPILQLHGHETPARVVQIQARFPGQVWKAVGVSNSDDLIQAGEYDAADRLLIDAKPPENAAYSGGHGQAFDWAILTGWTAPKPWMLAGGLTPENVAAAIAATGAPGVDVSSGVERSRGLKDRDKIEAFIRAAKEA